MQFEKIVLMSGDEQQSKMVCRMLEQIGFCQIATFAEATPFLTYVTENPDALVLLMQEGPLGLELAWNVRERIPDCPIIWFSDLDFAITAFRLKVSWFGLFPVTEEALRAGLAQVEKRHRPRDRGAARQQSLLPDREQKSMAEKEIIFRKKEKKRNDFCWKL